MLVPSIIKPSCCSCSLSIMRSTALLRSYITGKLTNVFASKGGGRHRSNGSVTKDIITLPFFRETLQIASKLPKILKMNCYANICCIYAQINFIVLSYRCISTEFYSSIQLFSILEENM